jgi:CRISPR-associated endonuclease/helicase Cas3
MVFMPYAHTSINRPWEPLDKHLIGVATIASEFADAFGAGEWGRIAGKWHDLGKYSQAFQNYLIQTADPDASEEGQAPGRVDHSTFGARYAAKSVVGHFGQVLAFCIAGHHAGLTDASTDDAMSERSTLAYRLDPTRYCIPEVTINEAEFSSPELKLPFVVERSNGGFAIAFFTRMLFSALVDADRTATEAFCNPIRAAQRNQAKPPIIDLAAALDSHLRQLKFESTPVNQVRAKVLADCLSAAPLPPGFFSLNVPTGGGKTFASLAFALHHAKVHK